MWQNKLLSSPENKLKSVDIKEISHSATDIFSHYVRLSLGKFIEKYGQNNPSKIKFTAEELNLKCGAILQSLKHKNDTRYTDVLNQFGDKRFCKFKIEKNKLTENYGLYFFEFQSELKYIGSTKQSFLKRINNGYGNISPRNCFKGGQSTNCKINSNLNQILEKGGQTDIKFYVFPMTDKAKIISTEKKLISKATSELNYDLWNKQHNV